MANRDDVAIAWRPLPDIPQLPCGIELDAAPGWVAVRAVYSFYEGDRDLIVELRAPVVGLFNEAGSPRVYYPRDYPRLTDPRWPHHLWPLMKIERSSWLSENRPRLFQGLAYEHIRIVSDDGAFDAIIEGQPDNVQWVTGKGSEFFVPAYRAEGSGWRDE
ncbi:hypothetical protein [Brevundimonas sp. Leaf363]|uniref:hypothetical protein n=1 Tax=Brevundimonas sp. Leaf363 TaxID=1736353 RepID=UPI0012E1371D|nr:hypothetical protein [Brevundimonas sp. Leaf363]